MKPYLITVFIIIPLFSTVTTTTHRRILRHPLFPISSLPSPTADDPFFHQNRLNNTVVTHPIAPQPANKHAKKIAVVISVWIVVLGMLSALAFFVYKHKSSKLVTTENSFNNERNLVPSNFLYIETVEPPRTTGESTNMNSNDSPYNKLHSIKRYRPSPELQPLPPLSKPQQQQPQVNSPQVISSSDDEEEEMNDFYAPNGSIVSSKSFNLKQNYKKNSSPDFVSKRTSPRSRFSVSSLSEEKQQQPPRLPPPGPDMTHLQQKPKIPLPPISPGTKVIPKIVKTMYFHDHDNVDASKPKLKPLPWDKVRVTSDQATVWDHLKSSSFQWNEDIMESLFRSNSGGGSAKKQDNGKSVVPPTENRILDPKKSQNIAILLKALNVTQEEVSRGLLQGNQDSLDAHLLETLVKMAPTKEEEIKLKDYRVDISKLGSAERFLKAILDIPFAFRRVEAMLYRANFENEVKYLRSSFQILEAASEELKKSRLFFKLLEAVLRAGNHMNVGTNLGEATAFNLDTLLKLVNIKGADGKTTLLHFVVKEIIRSEGRDMPCVTKIEANPVFNEGIFKKQGLQIVGELSRELSHVTKAAGMDSDVLSGYVTKLELGLQKIRSEVDDTLDIQGNFFGSMRVFIKEAEIELVKIKISEKQALISVKDVTEYFHGDTIKEGVYPFRIFMIVRDFLGILDNVCKEVGQMQDSRIMVGAATSSRAPSSAALPVVTRYRMRNSSSSSDEESSYSSPRDR